MGGGVDLLSIICCRLLRISIAAFLQEEDRTRMMALVANARVACYFG